MEVTIGKKLVGKENNGYLQAGSDTMLEIYAGYENPNLFDGKVIAKKGLHGWKSVKGGNLYNGLMADRFIEAPQAIINEAFPLKPSSAKIKVKREFGGGFKVIVREDDSIESSFNIKKTMFVETDEARKNALLDLITTFEDAESDGKTIGFMQTILQDKFEPINSIFDQGEMVQGLEDILKFFVEFQFTPSIRFINTIGHIKASDGFKGVVRYVNDYFNLITSPFKDAVNEKMKSPEFEDIINKFTVFEPSTVINSRLKLYYGTQGTGKTTKAMKETDGRCVICNNSVLPQDLLEDFSFNDGKPSFNGSVLAKCLKQGKSIVLDEINLLPFETIRFLQGLVDGKESFDYKGETIHIKEGFSIIGTMNLVVNGTAYGLPEPLIDRCKEIKEFKLTGKDLLIALA